MRVIWKEILKHGYMTDTVLSKQEIKEMVKQFTNSLDMGLIYYEQCGCNVTVFTSDKMKSELNKMKPGYQVTEERSEPLYLTDSLFVETTALE